MQNASRAAETRELILDYSSPDGPNVSHVRGTVLATALRVVREAGLYDRYLKVLPKEYEEALLYSVASSWLEVDVMFAHYETLERLNISDEIIEQNAARIGAALGETFFASVLRTAIAAGADRAVWTSFKHADRLFSRVFRGGGCRVYRMSPEEAVIEHRGLPFANTRYYRVAHVANQRGIARLFNPEVEVRQVRPFDADPQSLAVMMSWKAR